MKVSETIIKHSTVGETLLVASSDMSHYPSCQNAARVDKKMIEVIKTLDANKIISAAKSILRENIPGLSCTMCGESAVIITTIAAKKLGANCVTVLKYSNSGDSHPRGWEDKSKVVGYAAIAITRYPSLSPKAQKELLKLARKVIDGKIKGENKGLLTPDNPSPYLVKGLEELSQKLGLFVTLRHGKKLRG